MSARDEAAVRYAESVLYPNRKVLRPVDEYTLQQMRELSADDFKAGWDAGREELMGRIDAAVGLIRNLQSGQVWPHRDRTPLDALLEKLTTEEQER